MNTILFFAKCFININVKYFLNLVISFQRTENNKANLNKEWKYIKINANMNRHPNKGWYSVVSSCLLPCISKLWAVLAIANMSISPYLLRHTSNDKFFVVNLKTPKLPLSRVKRTLFNCFVLILSKNYV